MGKVNKPSVIRLDSNAANSMSVMLMELLSADKDLKVNHSKLVSSILTEYHSKHFEKAKPRLMLAYQDRRKHLKHAIESLEPEELEAAMKYLEKIKKTDSSTEKN